MSSSAIWAAESARIIVAADVLPVHIVRFLGAYLTIVARDIEHVLGFIYMNVNLRFALRAGENERVAQFVEGFTKLAAVDVGTRNDALCAIAVG